MEAYHDVLGNPPIAALAELKPAASAPPSRAVGLCVRRGTNTEVALPCHHNHPTKWVGSTETDQNLESQKNERGARLTGVKAAMMYYMCSK